LKRRPGGTTTRPLSKCGNRHWSSPSRANDRLAPGAVGRPSNVMEWRRLLHAQKRPLLNEAEVSALCRHYRTSPQIAHRAAGEGAGDGRKLASEAGGCRPAILPTSEIFFTFPIDEKTAIFALSHSRLGGDMRRYASLVALVSLFFSAVVHADNRLVPRPVQPTSLTLEPRFNKGQEVSDLSGNWQGYASVGRTRVNYDWQISQEGQKIFGTIFISTLDGLDKSTHAFEGTIQDSVVVFRATRWLSPQLSTWCMAAGKLKLDETTAPPELKGTWGANPIPGGCPTGSHGRVQLTRR
jgi:hypothetical protein